MSTKPDVLASNLLFAGCFIGTVINYFTKEGFFIKGLSNSFIAILIIGTLLALALYFCIRKGYKWAKITFILLYTISLIASVSDFRGLTKKVSTPLKAVNYTSQSILEISATVLLVFSLGRSRKAEQPTLPA